MHVHMHQRQPSLRQLTHLICASGLGKQRFGYGARPFQALEESFPMVASKLLGDPCVLRYVSFSAATPARHCLHMQTSISLEVAPVTNHGIAPAYMPLSKHSTDVVLNVCFGTQLMQAPTTGMCSIWQNVCLPRKCITHSHLIGQLATFKFHIINTPLLSATQPSTWACEA